MINNLRSDDIENIRDCYSLTQAQLASLTGYTTAYITMIENGQRRVTDAVSMRVASALNINASKLSELRRIYEQVEESRQSIRYSD
ncbi:helix-turn-helix transcriptional regulator [Bacillus sp. 37MA]|uniref:helix-turn-helix domain-containing protein n=1 Tax=Bacillus sp. 37MA TaxID=1132442 RepID=UPI00036FC062|nr:helix-turn-helix transcriptional regulator [Bacillus sp. 37MA]